MESIIASGILSQALKEGNLAVLVGSGASSPTTDLSGREYSGLPTPSQFVVGARKQFSFIADDSSFERACDAIYDNKGRVGLEDALLQRYKVPSSFEVPPAQRILSWLPFSTYITSNYDQFIERSLTLSQGRRHFVVIEDKDIVRMKQGFVPVIKYHGCVSRPETMIATSADAIRLDNERPLLQQLISVSLASRTLLVIGHGLEDEDLTNLIDNLVSQLDQYFPSIFIVREASYEEKHLPNLNFAHEIIPEDLTQFLNRLLHEYRKHGTETKSNFFDEAWLGSTFFASLRQAAVLPSETQVIDAFLEHLSDELGARNEVESVVADAGIAIENTLEERPNYAALRRTWAQIADDLRNVENDVAEAENIVAEVRGQREEIKSCYRKCVDVISKSDRILVYSQSQRVIQLLTSVPQITQRTCEIFVAECRPKSPSAYQDAAAICRQLEDTQYTITVCPDVVAINLIANGQISKILMGTHAIYVDGDETPFAFVNTCGSLAISMAAEQYGIPLLVVGESLKIEKVNKDEAEDHLYIHQEHDLLKGDFSDVTELRTRRDNVSHTNIGYDLVKVGNLTKVLIPDALEG